MPVCEPSTNTSRGSRPTAGPIGRTDPHLLRWVHLAELDSFLAAYRRYGAEPMSAGDADAYVADMARVASELGVPAPPRSVTGLRDQLRLYRGELRGTPEARQAARYLLLQPPMHPAVRAPYAVLSAAAVSLLPRWARRRSAALDAGVRDRGRAAGG